MTAQLAVIGGGPAGLMAAEAALSVVETPDLDVHLYDAMPSVGRKFLLAGKGGLNLTHAEPEPAFLDRYGGRRDVLAPLLRAFGAAQLRGWAAGLGIDTFVGSSDRVFPLKMKAAPLLRAWLRRLRAQGVQFHTRHRWTGWNPAGELLFDTAAGQRRVRADAVVFALGGASWPGLGSDGRWLPAFAAHKVDIAPLQPANCGFEVSWTAHFRDRYAGLPVKTVTVVVAGDNGDMLEQRGEFIVTANGVEGGVIYALSAPIRNAILRDGVATLTIDLVPDVAAEALLHALSKPRGSRTLASHLRQRAGLTGTKAGLLREMLSRDELASPALLAAAAKALPIRLTAVCPIAQAISTAGGIRFEALDAQLMLQQMPGSFCAGEMLDWEAPTGGFLLTACFAAGRVAGAAAARWALKSVHAKLPE